MPSSARWYGVALVLRFLLAVLPLSVLHPDEWMQSVQPMAHHLQPDWWSEVGGGWSDQQTWDWRFTCVDEAHLAHEGRVASVLDSTTREYACEKGMKLQAPIRGVLAPSVHTQRGARRAAWQRSLR